MKDLARLLAALVAGGLLLRDDLIAAGSPAMRSATVVCGLAVLVGLTAWRDGFGTVSAVALVGHYASALAYGDVQVDFAAPAVGALIVLYLDLLDLAASLPRDRRVDRAFALARLRHAGLVVAVGTVAGAAAFAVAAVPWPSSETFRAVGVAAVVLAVVMPVLALRGRR
jgi:hypothetical protein